MEKSLLDPRASHRKCETIAIVTEVESQIVAQKERKKLKKILAIATFS